MTLLESRLGQTERRIEREMTQIHGKMDDVFRNLPDKSYVNSKSQNMGKGKWQLAK